MEYLVTMTTHVPDGTAPAQVDDVRAREAAHTRELADQGHVLRLWRPPRGPGEWRTLGLFAAPGSAELERILAAMPLRVWRSDEVSALAGHPNDPPPELSESSVTGAEFFVTFTSAVPGAALAKDVAAATAGEAERTRELARQGELTRLWQLPQAADSGRPVLGLFRAADEAGAAAIVDSLLLSPYFTAQITPLTPHPSDPAAPGSRARQVAYGSPDDLARALRGAELAHGRHEVEIGHADPDWPEWYARYMVGEQIGAEHA
jgi:muconolactone delta-isomerase